MTLLETSPALESELFAGVDREIVAEIEQESPIFSVDKGVVLCRLGEEALYIFELLTGSVDILLIEKDDVTVTVREPREIIGWSALVEPYRYTATARSTSPCTLRRISRGTLEGLIERSPADGVRIFRNLAGVMAKRLRVAYDYIYFIRGGVHPLMGHSLSSR